MVILYTTPNNLYTFYRDMYRKMEQSKLPLPEVDLKKDINFFNNTTSYKGLTGYDQYYQYSKVFPLFDKRRMRENRQYQPDIWENIHEQEQKKAVPATTSMNYGMRPFYDTVHFGYNRQNIVDQFNTRKGMFLNPEAGKFTETVNREAM